MFLVFVVKKEDSICGKYRGISRPIRILCILLKSIGRARIEGFQFGFRPSISTINEILRQNLRKTHDNQVASHHLFVICKATFDKPLRNRVFVVMSLNNSRKSVKLEKNFSESFAMMGCFKRRDS